MSNIFKLDKLLLVEDKVTGEVKFRKNDRIEILSPEQALKEKNQKGLIHVKEDFSFIDTKSKTRVIVESGEIIKRFSEDENWDREIVIAKDIAVNFPVGARYLAADESNVAYTVISTFEVDDNNVGLNLKKLEESKLTELNIKPGDHIRLTDTNSDHIVVTAEPVLSSNNDEISVLLKNYPEGNHMFSLRLSPNEYIKINESKLTEFAIPSQEAIGQELDNLKDKQDIISIILEILNDITVSMSPQKAYEDAVVDHMTVKGHSFDKSDLGKIADYLKSKFNFIINPFTSVVIESVKKLTEDVYKIYPKNISADNVLKILKDANIDAWVIETIGDNQAEVAFTDKQSLELASNVLKANNILF